MIEHLLHGSPVSSAGIELICAVLGDIAARWPEGRTLRVLEIGADGGLTRRALDRLAQSGTAFRYAATSPDAEQAARLGFAVSAAPGASAALLAPGEPADALDDGPLRHHPRGACLRPAAARHGVPGRAAGSAGSGRSDDRRRAGAEPAVGSGVRPRFRMVARRGTGPASSPLRSGGDWRVELAIAGFEATRRRSRRGRAVADLGVLGTGAERPATGRLTRPTSAGSRRRRGAFADRADRDRSGREPRPARAARARRAPGQRYRSGRVRGRRRCAGRRLERYRGSRRNCRARGRGGRRSDRAGGAPDRAVAVAGGGRCAQRTPLWIVTTGAQQAAPSDFADGGTPMPIGVVGAAVWGFARVLLNETPLLSLRLVDFPPTMDGPSAGAALARELAAATPETEIVWTRSGRHVLRLRRGLPPRWAAPDDALALDARTAGRARLPALAAGRAPTAGTGRGLDRRACRRAQFPRHDVGDGAAARGGADRRLRRPDLRARMRRHRPRGRRRRRGSGGRRPGRRLRPRRARARA